MAETIEKVEGEIVTNMPNTKEEIVESPTAELTLNAKLAELEAKTGVRCAQVDFSNPASLTRYCDEINDYVGNLLISTANMSVNQEQDMLTEEDFKLIVAFDESLEQSKREAEKQLGFMTRLIRNISLAMGSESAKKAEEMKTYKGQFQAYVDQLNKVAENVDKIGVNAYSDIGFRTDIAEKMQPAIELLGVMLELGWQAKETYDQETVSLSENPDDMTKDLINYRGSLSTFFESHLVDLKSVHTAYRQQLQAYQMQQLSDMQQVRSAAKFIKTTKAILLSQGSTQILNKLQADRLQELSLVNEAANVAMMNNGKNLEENAKATVDLMLNDGIQATTLADYQQHLQSGISILADGRKQLETKVKKDQEILGKVDELLDKNQQEFLQLIQDASVSLVGSEKPGLTTISDRPARRRLSSSFTTKK